MPPKKAKKKTGKAKKGKGKKGKKTAKEKLDDPLKQALANAKLWESRLNQITTTRDDYRESTRTLLFENDQLQTQVSQAEKDTIDVISFLKNEDVKKDDQIEKLQTMVKELKRDFRKEKQQMIDEYTGQIQSLQSNLSEKTNEVKLMQSELKLVKEFRRKRAQMQKELDDIKDSLFEAEKDHKETLSTMERKFLEEKMRLQEEASKKISDLAERAHSEAISNLDETTKSIYKENVRLNESLGYHVKAAEDLKVSNEKLVQENEILQGEKDMNSFIVEEKITQTKSLQKQFKEASKRVLELEGTMTQLVKSHDQERNDIIHQSRRELEKSKIQVARADRALELKSKENIKIRKLAKGIVEQRSEVEKFFLDSLEHVKAEIQRNRAQYRKDAEKAYNKRMLAAHTGKASFPKVRNFVETTKSTNSVFSDLKVAEDWNHLNSTVDIADLTWEQRERVLRLLFAKMNGAKQETRSKKLHGHKPLPPIESKSQQSIMPPLTSPEQDVIDTGSNRPSSKQTFLTETVPDTDMMVANELITDITHQTSVRTGTEILANVDLN